MIAVDTSAVIAVLTAEPEAVAFTRKLVLSAPSFLSAANYVECVLVLSTRAATRREFDRWLLELDVRIVAHDETQARLAGDAFETYGRGRHPAALNFGDCFAYALAKSRGCPLLYKGEDFARTDIEAAQ